MQNKLSGTFLTTVILALIIGFLSGVVGELWLNSFLLPDPYLNFKSYSDLSNKLDDLISTQQAGRQSWSERDNELHQTVQKAQPIVVEIYKYKKMQASGFETLAADSFLGLGSVITNDGWILTNNKVVKNLAGEYYVKTMDGKMLLTEAVVGAGDGGEVFLKIKKNDLAVAEFLLKENLVAGQEVILFGKDGSVVSQQIKNINYSNRSNALSLVRSSEMFYRMILLSGNFEVDNIGSPVVVNGGRVIGFLSDVSGMVLPIDQLTALMKKVVKGEKWQKPYLGIKYYDLTEASAINLIAERGIQVLKNGGIAGDSPLRNKVLPEDLILAVEGEELSEFRNLPEILAQYQVGDTVTLKIKRGNEVMEAEVVLGGEK